MADDRPGLLERIVALIADGQSAKVTLEIASRHDEKISTRELAAPLLQFLDDLSMVSRDHFPQGGLMVGNFHVTDTPIYDVPHGESESREQLVEFFACVTGDLAREHRQGAEAIVSEFLELINVSYPKSTVHFRLHKTRGWFDSLETYISSDDVHVYFNLNWSVS